MPQSFQIRREGMTVELLLHQAYGVEGRALLEQTLAINPGVSALGPFLPLGSAVIIPDKPAKDAFSYRPVVDLFGSV